MQRRTGYLFLISHMRSRSTLLAHILGSHPQIDGYSELHRHYQSRLDLASMFAKVEEATGEPRRGRWLLDKLLHNRGIVAPEVLRRIQTICASVGERGRFLEAGELVDRIDPVLERLTDWLELSRPLVATYRAFRYTGVVGHGDPSDNIRAGRVLAPSERKPFSEESVDFDESAIAAAVDVYRETVAMLRARHPW